MAAAGARHLRNRPAHRSGREAFRRRRSTHSELQADAPDGRAPATGGRGARLARLCQHAVQHHAHGAELPGVARPRRSALGVRGAPPPAPVSAVALSGRALGAQVTRSPVGARCAAGNISRRAHRADTAIRSRRSPRSPTSWRCCAVCRAITSIAPHRRQWTAGSPTCSAPWTRAAICRPTRRVFDLQFADFIRDEIGMVRRIYERFGLELSLGPRSAYAPSTA